MKTRPKNTTQTYGLLAKIFHWLTALLVLGLLSMGFYMVSLEYSPFKFQIYGLHKSFGLLILFLAVLRLCWRFISSTPEELNTHQWWEKLLAKIIHILLYLCLFLTPLSGWLMSSAGDFPANFFNIFEMPDLVPKDKALFTLMKNIHELCAFIIIGAIGLHAAGAFKHHFIDNDKTLQRMTTLKLGVPGGLLLAIITTALLIIPSYFIVFDYAKTMNTKNSKTRAVSTRSSENKTATIKQPWIIDYTQSTIEFEVTQYDQPFTGHFKNFDGTIVFDPDNLADSHANITIDIASIDTGSTDRDEQARTVDWFDISTFPKAYFITHSFKKIDNMQFIAHGKLKIRNASIDISFPFLITITPSGTTQTAQMNAAFKLNRLQFGIGQGEWTDPSVIGNMVTVTLNIQAKKNL